MTRCPFCAEEIQDLAIKCKHCGESLIGRAGPTESPRLTAAQRTFTSLSTDEQDAMLAANNVFYRDHFRVFDVGGSPASWNWSAAFFGGLWMLHRKMWMASIVWIILSFIPVINWLLIPAFFIIGAFGNKLYYNHVMTVIREAYGLYPVNGVERVQFIGRRAGVTWTPVLIVVVLSVVALLLVTGLLAAVMQQ